MPPLHDLDPKYEPGRTYAVRGGVLNDLIRMVRARTPKAGPGLRATEHPDGIELATQALPGDDFDVEFTTLIFFQDAEGVLEVSEDIGVIREFHVRGGAWRIGPSDDDLEVRTLRIPGRIIAPNDTGDPFPEPSP